MKLFSILNKVQGTAGQHGGTLVCVLLQDMKVQTSIKTKNFEFRNDATFEI